MTVEQLIEKLQEMVPYRDVKVTGSGGAVTIVREVQGNGEPFVVIR